MKYSLSIVLVLLLAVSCQLRSPKVPDGPSANSGAQVADSAEIAPGALPYSDAGLILAGTVIPVQMERKVDGNRITFLLKAHGEVLEEETYTLDQTGFRIAGAAGEAYLPAIPLLRFPMKIGDDWKWIGKMGSGEIERGAEAWITTGEEPLNLPGHSGRALRVSVELSMESGGPTPAVRKLAFWFEPGKGIVKREFGASSSRAPLAETD